MKNIAPIRSILCFLMGFSLFDQWFSLDLSNGSIPILQLCVVAACFLYCLVVDLGKIRVNAVDKFIGISWSLIFVSFSFWFFVDFQNTLFSFERLKSFSVTTVFFLCYLVARLLINSPQTFQKLSLGLFVGGSVFTVEKLISIYGNIDTNIRASVGQRHPLLMMVTVAVSLYFSVYSKKMRPLAGTLAVINVGIILISLTRSAVLQLLFFSLLLLLIFNNRRFYKHALIFVTIALVAATSVGLLYNIDFSRLIALPSAVGGTGDASGSIRLIIWENAEKNILLNPMRTFFGFGELGLSFIGEPFLYGAEIVSDYSSHSEYIDVLIRRGLLGLVPHLLQFVIIGSFSFKLLRMKGISRGAIFLNTCILSSSVYGLFNETVRYTPFGLMYYTIFGAVCSLISLERMERPHN